MTYITEVEFEAYLVLYGGTDITGTGFDILALKASNDIDTATYNRITDITLLQTLQQTNIKYAVCSHAQTLSNYGDTASFVSDGRKISLGDLSVDGSSSNILDTMSNRSQDFLKKTGLMVKTVEHNRTRGYWQ